jgi:uncharacterized protein
MLNASEFAELESLLDRLRLRLKLTPRWEFCEGFMAALVCCRRPIAADEYLPVLLTADGVRLPLQAVFADSALQQRFLHLWTQRWNAVTRALDTHVTALDDPSAYQPEVMNTPAASQAPQSSLGQLWALGFMAAVNAWPEEWAGPRNKAAQHWRATTLDLLQALTQDDTDPHTQWAFVDAQDGPPTVSERRMLAFADAIWAVYNMREMWRALGPRVETVRSVAAPGRNDLCPCCSGKKFKKCCGSS